MMSNTQELLVKLFTLGGSYPVSLVRKALLSEKYAEEVLLSFEDIISEQEKPTGSKVNIFARAKSGYEI